MMNKSTESMYKTSDMSLATVISMRFPVRELYFEGNRGIFLFDETDELTNFIDAYWNKQLKVEPQAMFDALKSIKNRLYQEKTL